MDANGDKASASRGMLNWVLKARVSNRMAPKPINCDQNKDLKEPILFEKTPPRKS